MANKDATMNRLLGALDEDSRQAMRSIPTSEEAMARIYGTSVDKTSGATFPDETEKIVMVNLNDIIDHPKQPYRVEDNDDMEELVASIIDIGVLSPIILTDTYGDLDLGGKYMCVAGHRRRYGARKAGLKEVPAIVKSLSEEDADIMLVSSNSQREDTLPSEKAKAFKIRYEALKRKAGRPAENCGQLVHNLSSNRSVEIMAEETGINSKAIQRFLRLNELMQQWLKAVDNYALGDKKDTSYPAIGLTTGVALSFLPVHEQQYVWQSCDAHNMTLSLEMAEKLKGLAGHLTLDTVDSLFFAEKNKNKKEKQQTTLKFFSKPLMKKTDEFFPPDDMYKSPEIREQVVIEALDMYFKSKGIQV